MLLTRRISVEMVQKDAVLGVPIVVAVLGSRPRSRLRTADAAGTALVGIARPDGFDVFTHARWVI